MAGTTEGTAVDGVLGALLGKLQSRMTLPQSREMLLGTLQSRSTLPQSREMLPGTLQSRMKLPQSREMLPQSRRALRQSRA
eukprot:scaffold280173_cov13-Tisochrysis_lutea.AAC.1